MKKLPRYDCRRVELKWQKFWAKKGVYKTAGVSGRFPDSGSRAASLKPVAGAKFYVLDMFPYPSGEGLHVGHPKGYIATDVISRMKRMQGFNVLHPMGFDAFGLPAENYAIKTKTNPAEAMKKNVARYKKQLELIGFDYDWSREINTTDPAYYKWTQWIFLKLLKRGLAYQSYEPINWCPSCRTGLANEDVENSCCERCGTAVVKKPMRQWMLKITDYAERLLAGVDNLDWPDSIKELQKNWIGRSQGVEISFQLIKPRGGAGQEQDGGEKIGSVQVFTTRPDTLFGATYLVLAPEHPLIREQILISPSAVLNRAEVQDYINEAGKKNELERTAEGREKTGVELKGIKAINPASGEEISVWVADYVLPDYGTGAIMAVPAHDERDWQFAKKYGLPARMVVCPNYPKPECPVLDSAYTGAGHLVGSGKFDGMGTEDAKRAITDFVGGRITTKYKLRDWVFSRQRYWGEPIPVIHCDRCKNAKQKVILIHGFESSGEGNWFPWMKRELETRGFEVIAPTLPDSFHPDLDKWLEVLTPLIKDFGRNDVVIGHSLGSKAALHLIEKTGRKIGYLLLIASAIGELSRRDWEKMRRDWPGSDIDALKKFWGVPVDCKKISRLAGEVRVLVSKDDPAVPFADRSDIPTEWDFEVWNGFGHFRKREIPELLNFVLRVKNNGVVPVPENDLPVRLPKVKYYEPTGSGESPLAAIADWVNVKCPRCGSSARRETNTMPQWAGSSWYFMAYPVKKAGSYNLKARNLIDHWLPVDVYVGGAEHATRHLIYARFWHKFLYDIGVVGCGEPFQRLQHVGLIIGEDGRKMSKRLGNVINPDEIVEKFGADSLRVYEMFMGPFDQQIAWSTNGLVGARRFLEKIWRITSKVSETSKALANLEVLLHRTVKKVEEDIGAIRFNTAVSQLMICANAFDAAGTVPRSLFEIFLKVLSPFAPHIAEELWSALGHKTPIVLERWPAYDPAKIKEEEVIIVVQVNGKVRGSFKARPGISEDEAKNKALKLSAVEERTSGKTIRKIIFVKDQLLNFVV